MQKANLVENMLNSTYDLYKANPTVSNESKLTGMLWMADVCGYDVKFNKTTSQYEVTWK